MNDLAKILGIDEAKVNIKSINDHAISFYIQTDIKPHSCPNCNALTSKVHDYRIHRKIYIKSSKNRIGFWDRSVERIYRFYFQR